MLNLSKECINRILESAKNDEEFEFTDTFENMDSEDLKKIYDSSCPISGEVCEAMKEAMSDPKNVRTVVDKNNEIYVEASEFANFCEASGLNLDDAANVIIKEAEESGIEADPGKFHVVFSPTDVLQKNLSMKLGTGMMDVGYSNKDNWANKLITGVKSYGLIPNIGVEKDDSETVEM